MIYSTLVSPDILTTQLNNPNWVIIDCRFSLADTEAGARSYRQGHIRGAHYAHLDKDLSSAISAFTGRHPLPNFSVLAKKLASWGIKNYTQVVVYDDAGGVFAARLWWLLRTMGHENVAVLNGGLSAWKKQGGQLTTSLPDFDKKSVFRVYLDDKAWLNACEVENTLAAKRITLIDARTPERYRGEQEPIDPVAGHIPYSINRPFQSNLTQHGCFKTAAELQQEFRQLIGKTQSSQVVHLCGSGVTACHNLLAMEVAGLPGSKLYAGSWSEWIRNKNRAVATGA